MRILGGKFLYGRGEGREPFYCGRVIVQAARAEVRETCVCGGTRPPAQPSPRRGAAPQSPGPARPVLARACYLPSHTKQRLGQEQRE